MKEIYFPSHWPLGSENGDGFVPFSVRHDEKVKASAKMLFAELTSYGKEGFFKRKEIAEKLHYGQCRMKTAVNQLVENGYLKLEQQRDEKNHISGVKYILHFPEENLIRKNIAPL